MGFPVEMLTDMGCQFTSSLMHEVCRLISMKQLTTTPYHPMCNGLVERFNGSLKSMLKRICAENPHDWDIPRSSSSKFRLLTFRPYL